MPSDRRGLQPRKQPRQVRARLTRQRILSGAAHVFAEYGYAAGTTNRIAERAGVSIGSLYQYYPNKDAILAELAARHLEAGTAAATRRQEEEPPADLESVIRLCVRTATENHHDDPQLLRVLMEQAPRSPELTARMADDERARVAHIEQLLRDRPEIRVPDPHLAARLVLTSIGFLVHKLASAPDPVPLPRLEEELVAMLTRYLTAAPDGTAEPPA
ncbi:TetR/AcrR family transcriptional regulator [Streptomyces boncukensis]|uniref:TetR/AcrR family transcriptional regulator n=1 Tax=Streptomyces boncukensis TaxID=2711219 RepID=A0A6G4X1X5_9ACTN|nr:TetR/AcrR family transcriptional regulator [Streptomyces boncukensis]NGO70857.1 TetR/AcrR family transcriptional regulator [Streptomyces boncukensis]